METAKKMPAIQELRPFDSCVTLGRIIYSGCPECLPTADSLLAMMDRYQIAEALVHDHHARTVYPREHGNRRLLDSIKGLRRLHPVWVIEPPRKPGRNAARALVDEMMDAEVHAARLPMKKVPPLPWLWEDLLTVLEEHRVPCFLDFGQISTTGNLTDQDINGIRDIAIAHPGLPMVLSRIMGGLGLHPGVVPLIRRVNNLHIDISGILEYWREVACDVSPQRVLFATGAPFTDPGILISNVQYALNLSRNEKVMIYGDNLRRLIGAVR